MKIQKNNGQLQNSLLSPSWFEARMKSPEKWDVAVKRL